MNNTLSDTADRRLAPVAGYARPTLQDLRSYLLALRQEASKVMHYSQRGEIASAPICQNLAVIEAAITATITTVEAEIKAHTKS